jgi:hypothetical protein
MVVARILPLITREYNSAAAMTWQEAKAAVLR